MPHFTPTQIYNAHICVCVCVIIYSAESRYQKNLLKWSNELDRLCYLTTLPISGRNVHRYEAQTCSPLTGSSTSTCMRLGHVHL